jgi:glycosyltransferase involved in cell wall biosynthesis
MKLGYIPKDQRKKILLLCDDIRMHSGIATMAREIVIGTAHHYNWVNLAGAIQHPDQGKKFDICEDTNQTAGITDSSVYLYPINGYGTAEAIRQLMEIEKPDAIMLFTDPRYFTWFFQIEMEVRKRIPVLYLNIWDDFPAPIYNKPFYESCDCLMSISKQTKLINELVLGKELIKDKVLSYVPHGINNKLIYPVNEFMKEENKDIIEYRKSIFGDFDPEFVLLYNARNIRRKSPGDLIAAWSHFCDVIGKDKASKCALLMHTQVVDENGTDLRVVKDLLCDPEYQKVYFSENRLAGPQMNILYNSVDAVALISSNEGWGLSLTEGLMAGKMITATVTGGMQDQMRFEDEEGNWYTPSEELPSNHYGTLKNHGEWAVPVFPSNLSLVGSVPTPYIFDDRPDFRDIAKTIQYIYQLGPEERNRRGELGRKWVNSEESMMTAENMSKNVIESIDKTFEIFKPRKNFELLKVVKQPRKKILHKLVY